ncbi:substrate-binding domain-containing protein [Paremcibacter congregatus]|uniref:substrate-binding domain-containing protein n=1 Tax=Paremcibacter congregatus TaxID=2043170 RepID=UPI0030EBAD30
MSLPDVIKVGAVVPLSGQAGLYGPSCCNCFRLAAEEINAKGGILDHKIDLVFIDGGQKPLDVANNIRTLMENNIFTALVGMHDSDVRRAIIDVIDGRIPYIYTPTYEGGETAKGVFLLGETPAQQLKPVIPWLQEHRDISRWYLIGNDYCWPHKLHEAARSYITETGGCVLGERYVNENKQDLNAYVSEIAELNPDCVLISLVGSASVAFNRIFHKKGLSKEIHRFGTLVEENTLLASGAAACRGLLSASSYFPDLDDPQNQHFIQAYKAKFGKNAPELNALSQSCYEGMIFLQKLVGQAKSLEMQALVNASEGLRYQSARGDMEMHAFHVSKNVYLAEAKGYDFQILARFENISPY